MKYQTFISFRYGTALSKVTLKYLQPRNYYNIVLSLLL